MKLLGGSFPFKTRHQLTLDLIADTDEGLFVETNHTWSIDDRRTVLLAGAVVAVLALSAIFYAIGTWAFTRRHMTVAG